MKLEAGNKIMEDSFVPYDEVDTRELIRILIKRRRWIAIATIASAAIALGISLLLPKQYEATAMVALTKPDIVYRFDPRIETQVEIPPTEGLTELALSSEIIELVMQDLSAAGAMPTEQYVDELKERAEASLRGTLLVLSIKDQDPDRAAEMANHWARIIVDRILHTYASSTAKATLFGSKAEEAYQEWQAAQTSLINFQARNREPALRQTILALELGLKETLIAQQDYSDLRSNVQAVLSMLEGRDTADQSQARDQIIALVLYLRAMGIDHGPVAFLPGFELSLAAGEDLNPDETIAEQVAFLKVLSSAIDGEINRLSREAERLERELINAQADLSKYEQERARLEQDVTLAMEAHEALARKAQEVSLSEGQDVPAKIAVWATRPATPDEPRPLLYASLASVLGFIVASLGALSITWYLSFNSGENS